MQNGQCISSMTCRPYRRPIPTAFPPCCSVLSLCKGDNHQGSCRFPSACRGSWMRFFFLLHVAPGQTCFLLYDAGKDDNGLADQGNLLSREYDVIIETVCVTWKERVDDGGGFRVDGASYPTTGRPIPCCRHRMEKRILSSCRFFAASSTGVGLVEPPCNDSGSGSTTRFRAKRTDCSWTFTRKGKVLDCFRPPVMRWSSATNEGTHEPTTIPTPTPAWAQQTTLQPCPALAAWHRKMHDWQPLPALIPNPVAPVVGCRLGIRK
ncbi:hypothetical protein BDP81DRAFT_13026 [Colletotrichum phormii]|uniref:Uncharacterized protein n=1 Tax=Colletotrichum phormii TaxID=359342 RepID=A0AAJ0A6K7_9PEZI|nr:uncharacterized protein BDP81DRAFT_13026 [Colletotrichum phormii]KAK1655957.1 hypothetical protein BDP81DRAFT_13026 [Colletotrichum phormii]